MILSKLTCPECKGDGRDRMRGGLCRRCNGEGKARPTKAEEDLKTQLSKVCACQGGTGGCSGMCVGLRPSCCRHPRPVLA
jgi:hypothetical protein